MLDINKLREYGADVDSGLGRCMNNEAFYIKLVQMSVNDAEPFNKLNAAISEHDLAKAFEAAHSLKGVFANLALTPILTPVVEATELLRKRTDTDYSDLVAKINSEREKLLELSK